MKKILALCLTLIMVVSSFAMVVSAAEMTTITVPAQTVFDQSFAGPLSAAPEGWTLAGTYTFGDNGIRATNYKGFTLYHAEEFDAGKADYTFSATFAHNSGVSYLHFGASTADKAISTATDDGYTMKIASKNNNTGVYTIYKNGTEIGSLVDTNTSFGFQGNRTFTFVVTSEGITVTGAGDEFTYADTEPITKGYVGIKLVDNNGNKGNLKAMSLKTEEYSYEIEKPAEVVTGAAAIVGQEYTESHTGTMYFNNTEEFAFGGNNNKSKVLGTITDGADNMTIEANYTAYTSFNEVKLSFMGYTLHSGHGMTAAGNWVLKQDTAELGKAPMGVSQGDNVYHTVKIEFVDGKIKLYADDSLKLTVDDATPSRSGEVKIANNYSTTKGIKYIKAYSADYVDTSSYVDIKKTNFLMDKTFSANDSTNSLSNEGYSISGASAYTTGKGIVKTAAGALKAHYTAASFEGAYTVEVTAAKTMNKGTVFFNRTDANNHYSVSTKSGNSTSGELWIEKTVGGTTTSLLTDDAGATVASKALNIGTNNEMKYTITLEPMDNGNLKITVDLLNYADAVRTFTVVDEKTETNTPFMSGKIGYENGYSGGDDNRVEAFKVYPTPAAGAEVAKYEPSFQIGAEVATEIANGNVMFRFPVAMVGQNPDFIAVLYKDYEMVDIKVFGAEEANEGLYPLFDLTQNKSDNVSVAVYTWNSLEGMAPVLDTVVLD